MIGTARKAVTGALLCVCATLGAHPLLLNLPVAGESLWGNPAMLSSSIRPATRDVDLPLGAAALLALPDRSPLVALANDDWSQIDLLKTLVQVQHPRMVVVGAPASPKSVEIRLTAGGDAVPSDLAYEWSAFADAGHAHRRGGATVTASSV